MALKLKLNKLKKSEPEVKKKKVARGEKKAVAKAKKKVKAEPVVEPKKEFKAGKRATATEDINCLACMHWKKCTSKRKSREYACTRLKPYPIKEGSAASAKGPTIIFKSGKDHPESRMSKEERVIEDLIKRTLKGSGVVAADERINDQDIPTAPNFYTWVNDNRFIGTLQVPWAKQIEHPTKMLGEWCPNRKCTDVEWFTNGVKVDDTPDDFLEKVTFLEYGKCPKCGTTKSEHVANGLLMPYNALAGLAGQRLAKTSTAVMIVSYDLHRLLKSQNPSAMYGVMASQVLTGTFAALTFDQAKANIWNNIYNILTTAPWFMEYHAMLKDQSYRLGIDDVFQVTNISARYRHRNLFYHVSGPNKRTMRGMTRVTAMIDEIGWFMQNNKTKAGTDPERLDAAGTHDALDRSLLTVRSAAEKLLKSGQNDNVPMGYLYEVSSPSSKNDMIMQRYEASRGSRTIYGYRMATWEGNPTIPRDSEIIVQAYKDNAITANRDYAAIPPVSGNPFVKLSSLKAIFSNKRENGGELKTIRITNRAGQTQTSGKIRKLKAYNGEPCVLAIDAGSVNNSFAFAVLYANAAGRIICPFIGEIFPSPEAPIHFPHIVEGVLTQLIEHYNIGMLMSDRWQSIMLLQTLAEEHELVAVSRSLKYPDFDNFRQTAIYDGALQLPMLEMKPKAAVRLAAAPGYPGVFNNNPIAHLLFQFVAVNDVPNVSVMKPDGGTDDLFRALVLAYTGITDPEYAFAFEVDTGPGKVTLGMMVGGQRANGGASTMNAIGAAVGPRGSLSGGNKASMGAVSGGGR